jgi:hypothetical protein
LFLVFFYWSLFCFLDIFFFGVKLLVSYPTSNLGDRDITFRLGCHLWPVRHGRTCQYLRYSHHFSKGNILMLCIFY